MKKEPTLKRNTAGGIDLLVERDAGNEVRILTGREGSSLKFWEQMRELADEAIEDLSNTRKSDPETGH
jgi:hypothetical protein